MSSLEPRSGNRPSRKDREARAFRLAVAGGSFGAVAAVGCLLAAINVVGFGIPLLAGLAAIACLLLFRRSVGL